MDLNFHCPGCNQELSVDDSMVGTQVGCPSCGDVITVPAAASEPEPVAEVEAEPAPAPALARRDRTLSVPTRPTVAPRIEKPNAPLAIAAARASAKKLQFKTYRHVDYVKDGKDRFDEVLTQLVEFAGQEGIVAMHPIHYTVPGKDGAPPTTDFGVVVVYKG